MKYERRSLYQYLPGFVTSPDKKSAATFTCSEKKGFDQLRSHNLFIMHSISMLHYFTLHCSGKFPRHRPASDHVFHLLRQEI